MCTSSGDSIRKIGTSAEQRLDLLDGRLGADRRLGDGEVGAEAVLALQDRDPRPVAHAGLEQARLRGHALGAGVVHQPRALAQSATEFIDAPVLVAGGGVDALLAGEAEPLPQDHLPGRGGEEPELGERIGRSGAALPARRRGRPAARSPGR